MRYRQVVVSRHGGPDVLTLVESEMHDPGPGEVRVACLPPAYRGSISSTGAGAGCPAARSCRGARHLWRSYRALRAGGRLVWLGSAATKRHGVLTGLLSLPVVLGLGAVPDGKRAPMVPDVGRFSAMHHAWYRATLTKLLDLLALGAIRPVAAERLSLAEARHAHELLESGGVGGKIVLVTHT